MKFFRKLVLFLCSLDWKPCWLCLLLSIWYHKSLESPSSTPLQIPCMSKEVERWTAHMWRGHHTSCCGQWSAYAPSWAWEWPLWNLFALQTLYRFLLLIHQLSWLKFSSSQNLSLIVNKVSLLVMIWPLIITYSNLNHSWRKFHKTFTPLHPNCHYLLLNPKSRNRVRLLCPSHLMVVASHSLSWSFTV